MLAGCGLLQDGVLLSIADPGEALASMLQNAPEDARVLRTTLAMSATDAARAAGAAWGLGQVAAVFHADLARLRAALEVTRTSPPPSAATLRRFNELARDTITDSLRDPGLPPELLPWDWPGRALSDALAAVTARFYPSAHAYVETRLARLSVGEAASAR
jgi:phenylacetic acid degradation operon negative regulatory protein